MAADTENQGDGGVIAQAELMDPRWIALRPSRRAFTLLSVGILLAALAVYWANPLPDLHMGWKALAIGLVVGTLFLEARIIGFWDRNAVHAFYLIDLAEPPQAGGKGTGGPRLGIRLLVGRKKAVQDGVVAEGAFVTPAFTAIPYRLDGDAGWRPNRTLPLWPDSLEREAFRALRVQLKWR